MHYVILAILMFFIIFFSWKWWGKSLTNYFVNEPEKEHRKTLERKIEFLKKSADDLKESDDEVRVTKMLKVIQKQLKDKENELKKLDKSLGL